MAAMNRAGAETMLMNLHRRIDRNILQFDYAVCAENKCDYDDEILNLGGRLIKYPRYKIKNHFKYMKFWDKFFAQHDEYKIVHGHMGSTAPLYLAMAKKHGKFVVAHAHNTRGRFYMPEFMYKIYSHEIHKYADYFMGCSMQALEAIYGESTAHDNSKSSVFNNAIEAERYIFNKSVRDEVRHELNLSAADFVIGTVGRLSQQKNPGKIIEILLALKNRGINFKFLWAGAGELKDEIEKLIYANKLSENIKMLGLRNDVNRILQALDVFICPSLWEGLPIVAIEAQAAGLASLCSDRCAPEINITSLCKFLPIDNELDNLKWIDAIIKCKDITRRNTFDEIKRAGFDISATAEWLQDFYINKAASLF
ncbi:MAG: glycosyltransferase [Synergistaceae bacterium]|nr:glycosyltransferase [Synergistaceae bacterium]